MDNIKLTQFSHGAGCGCKISPQILSEILAGSGSSDKFENLLVGHDTKDDAAVIDLDGENSIISTTDFFMPIVDDPLTFGAIAATNAISDIYAIGGEPLMAIAILGWPVNKISSEIASDVIRGGREVCTKAGIPLAGGHSIDSSEPIFGLAVTGKAKTKYIKKNQGAQEGDLIYLTKPIGVGLVTTAEKKGLAKSEDTLKAQRSMLKLNDIGYSLSKLDYVHALTDVTGFGLAGHLKEVCESSSVSASINYASVPKFDFVNSYLEQNCIPGGTKRNWDSYGSMMDLGDQVPWEVIADPQTSGGLLVFIKGDYQKKFEETIRELKYDLSPIGVITSRNSKLIKFT